jgi:hypothetical protein
MFFFVFIDDWIGSDERKVMEIALHAFVCDDDGDLWLF